MEAGLERAHQPGRSEPVFQRIARADRRTDVVVEHPPLTAGVPAEIGGIDVQPIAAWRLDPDLRPPISTTAGDQRRRQRTGFDQFLVAERIVEQDFEKFYVKGNKAAGVRVRKAMNELKKKAQDIRVEVQNMKTSEKAD